MIDFVIPWVDGGDPEWREDFIRYGNLDGDQREARYRDWGNLQYLFRAFEEFTPWVNKIYFVTHGHLPKWLNINHPKLIIVKHKDFLDEDNLPVFNINPIEINFHKIEGLSEKFVYFNDDTFILTPLKPRRFFDKGLPVGVALQHIGYGGEIAHIVSNDLQIINKHFNKHKVIRDNVTKWFNPKYGMNNWRSVCLMPWKVFSGFYGYHHPQPLLKQTYEETWKKEPEIMEKTSASKIRSSQDVNQYLFRYWQFVSGNFTPGSYREHYKESRYVEVRTKEDAIMVAKEIRSKKFHLYCPNDALTNVSDKEFEEAKQIINNAFRDTLPNKSKFELRKAE